MRLKVLTTASFLFGMALLLLWPVILGPQPPAEEGKQVLARYGLKVLLYFGVTSLAFVGTAVLALVLVRRTKEEFRTRATDNLRDLIEGTLRDHGREDR